LEADEEDKEDEEEPVVEATVSCTVKSVEMEEGNHIPSKTYVNFKYAGHKEVCTRFMSHMMTELKMFQLEGNVVRGAIE